jgi:hypothetical protein
MPKVRREAKHEKRHKRGYRVLLVMREDNQQGSRNLPVLRRVPGRRGFRDRGQKRPGHRGAGMGINSLWAFLFPFLGFPVSVVGVIMGIVGYKSSKRGMALAGIILSIIGFVASVINAAIGAYMGATGQLF